MPDSVGCCSRDCAFGLASGSAGHGANLPVFPRRSVASLLRSSVQTGRPHDRAPSPHRSRLGGPMTWIGDNTALIWEQLREHLYLAFVPMVLGLLIAVPLG